MGAMEVNYSFILTKPLTSLIILLLVGFNILIGLTVIDIDSNVNGTPKYK